MYVYVARSPRPYEGPVYYFADPVLDQDNTEILKDRIVRVVNETMPPAVYVDLSNACTATECGVAQLRRLRRDLRVVGCDLHLHGVAESIRDLLDAAKLPTN
jgi:ABC-type transporter Mla MlaB component